MTPRYSAGLDKALVTFVSPVGERFRFENHIRLRHFVRSNPKGNLKTKGFEQHAEILCKVIKKGEKFYEVPISFNGRTHKEGKKIKWYHIFKVITTIILGRLK